jgi:hypothetical protein
MNHGHDWPEDLLTLQVNLNFASSSVQATFANSCPGGVGVLKFGSYCVAYQKFVNQYYEN